MPSDTDMLTSSLPVSAVWTARAFFIRETRSALRHRVGSHSACPCLDRARILHRLVKPLETLVDSIACERTRRLDEPRVALRQRVQPSASARWREDCTGKSCLFA